MVNMAAYDAVDAVLDGILRQGLLEITDEVDGVLDPQLGPSRERPVREAQAAADDVEPRIGHERGLVSPVSEMRQPARMADHDVEVVTVRHEKSSAVGRRVNGCAHHLDASEGHAAIL